MAAGLRERGVAPGDRVALMLRTEAAFFDAFFGVLLAGGVPVPIYPPFRRGPDRGVCAAAGRHPRQRRGARADHLPGGRAGGRPPALPGALAAPCHARGRARPGARPAWRSTRACTADDPALIQYTSGSTGDPKGVLLSHANLLANIRAIGEAIAIRPDDVAVSWLPLYHDMGLIGVLAGRALLRHPDRDPLAARLPRPSRPLALGDSRPPRHHVRRAQLRLRPLRPQDRRRRDPGPRPVHLAARPERLGARQRRDDRALHARASRPYGFRPEAMCPVYGLAEASVALTVADPGAAPRIDSIAREPFRSGDALVRRRRTILTAPPRELRPPPAGPRGPDRGRGGPAARRPRRGAHRVPRPLGHVAATSGTRRPRARRSATAGWTRAISATGPDGDLFVTGRRKDLIIKAGRNLYPQEVEEIVGAVAGIRKGCVAAFGVPDPAIGTERLVVIAESRETEPAARAAARGRPSWIAWSPPSGSPRTWS